MTLSVWRSCMSAVGGPIPVSRCSNEGFGLVHAEAGDACGLAGAAGTARIILGRKQQIGS